MLSRQFPSADANKNPKFSFTSLSYKGSKFNTTLGFLWLKFDEMPIICFLNASRTFSIVSLLLYLLLENVKVRCSNMGSTWVLKGLHSVQFNRGGLGSNANR